MPAKSVVQQHLMGMDYARAKAGKPTMTGMSTQQLKDFASTPTKGLPQRKAPKKRGRKLGGFNYAAKSKSAMHGRVKVT